MKHHPQTESYKALQKLSVLGAKNFGMMSPNGMLWQWDVGDLHVRHDEGEPDFPMTMLYLRGALLYRLDDVEEPLAMLRQHLLLDELADV